MLLCNLQRAPPGLARIAVPVEMQQRADAECFDLRRCEVVSLFATALCHPVQCA